MLWDFNRMYFYWIKVFDRGWGDVFGWVDIRVVWLYWFLGEGGDSCVLVFWFLVMI